MFSATSTDSQFYNFESEENAQKWRHLFLGPLKRVIIIIIVVCLLWSVHTPLSLPCLSLSCFLCVIPLSISDHLHFIKDPYITFHEQMSFLH